MNGLELDHLARALDTIYDCAVGLSEWDHALTELAALTHSSSSVMLAVAESATDGQTVRGWTSENIGASTTQFYVNELTHRDNLWSLTDAVQDDRLIVSSALGKAGTRRSDVYDQWYGPLAIDTFIGTVLERTERQTIVLSVNRSCDQGPHRERERALLTQVASHFRRAFQTKRILSARDQYVAISFEMLASLHRAAILVDRLGRVLHVNEQAQSLLDEHKSPLTVREGQLIPDDSPNAKLICRIIQDQGRRAITAPKSLSLGEGGERDGVDLHALLLPMSKASAGAIAGKDGLGGALLVLGGSQISSHDIEPDLMGVFELTPGEARVAAAALRVVGIEEIAAELGLGRETVRSHLKRIYAKSSVSSQTGFVQLVRDEPRLQLHRMQRFSNGAISRTRH